MTDLMLRTSWRWVRLDVKDILTPKNMQQITLCKSATISILYISGGEVICEFYLAFYNHSVAHSNYLLKKLILKE